MAILRQQPAGVSFPFADYSTFETDLQIEYGFLARRLGEE
jgi:hypothetical protein